MDTDALIAEAFASHQRGDRQHAETLYLHVLSAQPDHLNALQLLGGLMLAVGQNQDAVDLLRQAVAVLEKKGKPQAVHAALYLNLAQALLQQDDIRDAITAIETALSLDPNPAMSETSIEVLFQSALACHKREEREEAADLYRAVLQLTPDHAKTLAHLALLQQERGVFKDVKQLCERLLTIDPLHANGHCLLGISQQKLRLYAEAVESFRRCLTLKPDLVQAHVHLGEILAAANRPDEAIAAFEQALALRPSDPDLHISLGNLLQERDAAAAQQHFQTAYQIRPLTTWAPATPGAAFRVLLLMAPGIANTPIDYLVGNSNYAAHFLCVMPSLDYDLYFLRQHGDVVVNLVCDADQGRDLLPMVDDLVQRLERPVVNPPIQIGKTSRAEIAANLAELAGCRVPWIKRVSRAELLSNPAVLADFQYPFLLRVAGKHGGDDFDLMAHASDIAAFLARSPADIYYAIDYIDYRSVDGYFRKYRLIFIDDQILPYHLAIGSSWKVHHITTDMDKHPWMQQEEAAFLENPSQVFLPSHQASLRAIRQHVGLDYFGIDCGLDREGRIVIFEVNASMLVHDDNADFPYKAPAVARIKQAFDAMLMKRATSTSA